MMFDRYNCINSFCHLKTFDNASKRSFLYYYNGAQKHEGFLGFENACSRARTIVIVMSLNYVLFHAQLLMIEVNFCDGLDCVFVKYQSRASTAPELT